MGNCALKPKVLTGTGAPAPEKSDDHLFEYQKLDSDKSLGHLLLEGEAKEKPDGDEKITAEAEKQKPPETGDRTDSVETVPKQELSTETKPETDDKNPENQETVQQDDLEKIEDKKVVEDVPISKETENKTKAEEDEKEKQKKEEEKRKEPETK